MVTTVLTLLVLVHATTLAVEDKEIVMVELRCAHPAQVVCTGLIKPIHSGLQGCWHDVRMGFISGRC